jgi:hypothetical protein
MKRILLTTILGIMATVSTHGQGTVFLNNYVMNSYAGAPVYYGNAGSGGTVGVPIAGPYNVQLAYFVGPGIVDPAGSGDLLGSWLMNAAIRPESFYGWGVFLDYAYTLPDYPSTGRVPVQLEMLVFTGSTYATSTIRGHSAAFTLSWVAVGAQIPPSLEGLQSFSIYLIPEPSGLGLAGLGIATLMVLRRRRR